MDDSIFASLRNAIAEHDLHVDTAPAVSAETEHDLQLVDNFEARLEIMQKHLDSASAAPRKKPGPKPQHVTDPLKPHTKHSRASKQKVIAVLDFETDPFDQGASVKPFVWEIWDGKTATTYWNRFNESECIPELIKFLDSLPEPHLIYAHNGGKFDFLFLLKHIRKDMLIINGRIVSAFIGKHEIRDSFAILPVGLAEYKKDEISYDKFAPKVRAKYYHEILRYLHADCEYLHELILKFHAEFGNVKTMASAAMKEFRKFYTYETCNDNTDRMYREFYYGGRVQCFEAGVIKTGCSLYDVNSMYPYTMKAALHPISDACFITPYLTKRTCFIEASGQNFGAFPMRLQNGSLDFTVERGRFKVSIHEWIAALETKTFKPEKIHACHNFFDRCSFGEFVDHFYSAKLKAIADDDAAHELFYKLVMNSCYGKFAQNPRDFKDYEFRDWDDAPEPFCSCDFECMQETGCTCGGWNFELENEQEKWKLWFKNAPLRTRSFYNIMTAASITGASRAVLLRGIVNATRPMYCDTDSILCEHLSNVPIDPLELGAWKLEKSGTWAAIAGKKLYALFSPFKPKQKKRETEAQYDERIKAIRLGSHYAIKLATKGARLTPGEIVRVANGETIKYTAKAPVMKLDGSSEPLRRDIKRTA